MSLRRYLSIFLRTIPWKSWVPLTFVINTTALVAITIQIYATTRLSMSSALLYLFSNIPFVCFLFVPVCVCLTSLANPLCKAGWMPITRFATKSTIVEWQQLSCVFAAVTAYTLCIALIAISYYPTLYFLDNHVRAIATIPGNDQSESISSFFKVASMLGCAVVVLSQLCLIIDTRVQRSGLGVIGVFGITILLALLNSSDGSDPGIPFLPHTHMFAENVLQNQSMFFGWSIPLQAMVFWALCIAIVMAVGRRVMVKRLNIQCATHQDT